jgi:hypothetical protein
LRLKRRLTRDRCYRGRSSVGPNLSRAACQRAMHKRISVGDPQFGCAVVEIPDHTRNITGIDRDGTKSNKLRLRSYCPKTTGKFAVAAAHLHGLFKHFGVGDLPTTSGATVRLGRGGRGKKTVCLDANGSFITSSLISSSLTRIHPATSENPIRIAGSVHLAGFMQAPW